MSSTISTGSATAPASGAAIATTGALADGGEYTVTATVQLSGTTAAGDLNNVQLQVGATVVGTLFTVIPTATGAVQSPPVVVSVPGGTAVTVNAIGAGTVAAVYKAQIVCTSG